MRGMLSFYILWLLSNRSMNGQELCKELARRRGSKPSAGTIYPALRSLRENGLVNMERQGRATIYSISEKGRDELERACKYFCSVFGEILQDHIKSTHK
ncbi:MAG: PadR family transcriptional regulator [Candidatus Methanomethyliaceae archaeon]|nr:PadR family transcriptional regulator [Candidatus Methanomethyliaceae archaeon]